MKVLYCAYYKCDGYPFHDLADVVEAVKNPEKDMTETDSALVVWGGADISPKLYNHPQSRTTWPSETRDDVEWAAMKQAVKLGIPIIGVCRGAQMLCALAGGYLIQDVSNHAGSGHYVETYDGHMLLVNSLHHQMLAIEDTEHELLAWSAPNRSQRYIYKDDLEWAPPKDFKEPEFVHFPTVKGLAVQWHPEMMAPDAPATQFVLKEYYERYSKVGSV